MEELISKIKQQIIAELDLEGIEAEDIDINEPLFEGGLKLDSIDALSLVVLLDKEYGISIVDPEQGRKILHSVKTMVDHIIKNKKDWSVKSL